MKGAETTFQELFSGQKTYRIPYFQRQYDWKDKNWEDTWEDVLAVTEAIPPCRHFMGAIVTKCLTTAPQGVSSFLVIDGQQRLISLSLLLAALRDAAKGCNPALAKRIEGLYLRNEYASGSDAYKILPTSRDQRAYFSTIDASPRDQASRIVAAYRYFSERIARFRESHNDEALA